MRIEKFSKILKHQLWVLLSSAPNQVSIDLQTFWIVFEKQKNDRGKLPLQLPMIWLNETVCNIKINYYCARKIWKSGRWLANSTEYHSYQLLMSVGSHLGCIWVYLWWLVLWNKQLILRAYVISHHAILILIARNDK